MNLRLRDLFLFASTLTTTFAYADTFTVTNVSDSGAGSLRQAITDANNVTNPMTACEQQTIQFNIPGSGVHTIRPQSALPPFDIPIWLDGYSQVGSKENTLTDGDNAVITIEIDGSSAGSSNGLTMGSIGTGDECGSNGSIVDGVAINHFSLAGIDVAQSPCTEPNCFAAGDIHIYGSFIGTDPTGLIAKGNGVGLHFGLNSNHMIVGDELANGEGGSTTPAPLLRNIISGNVSDGVRMDSTDMTLPSQSHVIRYNYIGVDATGAHALANGGFGVLSNTGGKNNHIEYDIIGGHSTDGVRIVGGQGGSVLYNAIGVGVGGVAVPNAGDGIHISDAVAVSVGFYYPGISGTASIANNVGAGLYVEGNDALVDVAYGSFGKNGGLGIDLAPGGENPTDAINPGTGPNQLINAPVLLTATFNTSTFKTVISGELEAAPSSDNEIDFYLAPSCDPMGLAQGQYLNIYTRATADASGYAAFSATEDYLQPNQAIIALTRREADNPPIAAIIASEFSNCLLIGDSIFYGGFGP